MRGTSNTNSRGSSYQRRARRSWMIDRFGIPRKKDGRKTRIRCHWCSRIMRAERGPKRYSWEIDRWPKCGHDRGRYDKANIVPACSECNGTRCKIMGKRCRGRAPAIKSALYDRRLAREMEESAA